MRCSITVLLAMCFALAQGLSRPARGDEAFFLPLGDLPGGEFYSRAIAVSADGEVIVGSATSEHGTEAFRWTRRSGMEGLGDLPGEAFTSEATAVSADGEVVVGVGTAGGGPDSKPHREAFRWTREEGMRGLGSLGSEGGTCSEANGVSADGTVVIGTTARAKLASNGWVYTRSAAFRWTEKDGMQLLPDLFAGDSWAVGLAVSADGSTVVGYCEPFASSPVIGRTPVRWEEGVVSSLMRKGPRAKRYERGNAFAISPDGVTIAGVRVAGQQAALYYWTAKDGMITVNSLMFPRGISTDGRKIVGDLTTGGPDEAVVWDSGTGVRSIHAVLTEAGVKADGWKLNSAQGITPDGRFVVGSGTNPEGKTEAWLVRLPRED